MSNRLRRVPTPPPPIPQDPEPSLVGKLIGGRYQVHRRVGEGGMARVYQARCPAVGTSFAIKVARRARPGAHDNIARLERETWTTSRLEHPNCVAAIDCGRTDEGDPYFVMEYLRGKPLSDAVGRPLAVSAVLELARQLLLALGHCHRAGVVHRDVKPGNIMIDGESLTGRSVKLFDFGLARVLPGSLSGRQLLEPSWTTRRDIGARITRASMVAGTPTYMAPEIARGKPATAQSDLYAVGVTMFFLLTGRRPVEGDAPADIMRRKLENRAPLLGEIAPGAFSRRLEHVVARALERDPKYRIENAEEFIDQLEHVKQARGGGLAPTNSSTSGRWLRRATTLIAGS